MGYIFDGAAALIIILFLIFAARKGTKKAVINFIIDIVCFAGAFCIAFFLGDMVYNDFVVDPVTSGINETITSFDLDDALNTFYKNQTLGSELKAGDIARILESEDNMDTVILSCMKKEKVEKTNEEICNGLYTILSESFVKELNENLPACDGKFFDALDPVNNKKEMFGILCTMKSNPSEAGKLISEKYVSASMKNYILLVLFTVSAVVILVIVKLIAALFMKNKDFFAIGFGDGLGGAIFGILSGALFVVLYTCIFKCIVQAGFFEQTGINDLIKESFAFKYVYNLDETIFNLLK